MNKWISIGALGLAAMGADRASAQKACDPRIQEARSLLEEEEATSALERLGSLTEQTDLPKDCRWELLLVMAKAQERLGMFAESATHWRALAEGPTFESRAVEERMDVLRGLAGIERKLRNLSASLRALNALRELDPGSLSIGMQEVETAQAMGDELGAVRILLKLREQSPEVIEFEQYRKFELTDAAADYLQMLQKAGQTSAFERTELARLYQEKGQLDLAMKLAAQLAEANPQAPELQTLLGGLSLAQGNLDGALTHYEKALDLDKSSEQGPLLESLGEVFFQRGEKDKAIKIWRRSVHAGSPQEPFEELDLARIFREHSLYDEALEILLRFKNDERQSLPAHLYVQELADTYYVTGESVKAFEEYLGLVRREPAQLDFIEADLQRMLGEDLEMCEDLSAVKLKDPGWAEHLFLARSLEFCGIQKEATWNYLRSFLLRNQLSAIAAMFTNLVRNNKFEEAAWLEQALKEHQLSNTHLLFYRARLAEEQKHFEEAEKLFREYIEKSKPPNRVKIEVQADRGLYDDALYHRALLLMGPLHQPAEAARLLSDLIVRFRFSGQRPNAEAQLGLALYREGQKEDALRHLDAVGPSNPIALAMLGEILFAEGDLDKARIQLRRALADYPDRSGSQPELLSLLQIVKLTDAAPEDIALACAYQRGMLLEDWALAESSLRKLEASEQFRDFAVFQRACLLERLGRTEEAKPLYDSLLSETKPEWMAVSAAQALDRIYEAGHQLEPAIEALEKIILAFPNNPRIAELRSSLTDRKASAAAARPQGS